MRIAVLTSSRADYGIYLPLLKKLRSDSFFETEIIAFGTHLSIKHGYTIDHIIEDGFTVRYKLNTVPKGDKAKDIADSIAKTTRLFSSFWSKHSKDFDLVVCLGDRYEMFAAIAASVPFNIPLAHFHGGESTLGAIDNKFRHAISAMSDMHFTSHIKYAQRVKQIIGFSKNIYSVGALSLDNLKEINLLSISQFKNKFGVDLSIPTVLITFHPETISYEKNSAYTKQLIDVMSEMKEQIIITMPNADTMGNQVRYAFNKFISKNKSRVFGFESMGTQGYFSCMSHCSFLLGNTSSGIIEAASFGKYVINIGNRQKGRLAGKNVLNVPINKQQILKTIKKISGLPKLSQSNIYGNGNAADKIISVLKKLAL